MREHRVLTKRFWLATIAAALLLGGWLYLAWIQPLRDVALVKSLRVSALNESFLPPSVLHRVGQASEPAYRFLEDWTTTRISLLEVTDEELPALRPVLARHPEIERLIIDGCNLTDDDVRWLSRMTGMNCLEIVNTELSESHWRSLRNCPATDLHVLLAAGSLDASACAHIAAMPKLTSLSVTANLSNAGLKSLARSKTLKSFRHDAGIMDGTAYHEMVQLDRLSIVVGAKIPHSDLARFPAVRELAIISREFGGAELEALSRSPAGASVEKLGLNGTAISDADLPVLARFPRLKSVFAADSYVTWDGMRYIERTLKLEAINEHLDAPRAIHLVPAPRAPSR